MTGPDADRIAALSRNVARRYFITPASLLEPGAMTPLHLKARAVLIVLMRESGFAWKDIARAVYIPPGMFSGSRTPRTVEGVVLRMESLARRTEHMNARCLDKIEAVIAARNERLRKAREKRHENRMAAPHTIKIGCGAWDDGTRMGEALAREGRDFSADAVPDDLDRGAPCYRVIAPNFAAQVMREANC